MRLGHSFFIVASLAMAQTPVASTNAGISGIVKDKTTGTPMKDYVVSTYVNAVWANGGITMSPTSKQVTSTTDEHGAYKLNDLPPAQYHVMARSAQGFGGGLTRIVTVAGHDIEGIDFKATAAGSITGKVVDENKDPVPGMSVVLVSREYYLGTVGYYLGGFGAVTDDRGEYTISRAEAGHAYFVMAEMRPKALAGHSETPLNPKMRKRVPMRTWYPGAPSKDGAAPIVLRPGERREGIDIEVKKSASYCVDGILSTANGPGALNFTYEGLQPSSGVSTRGGSFMGTPRGTAAPNGEFRVCDLYPGSYRFTVSDPLAGPQQDGGYTITNIVIADQDLHDVRIATLPGLSMEAEAVLEGVQPQTPLTTKASVTLRPLFRTQVPGERLGGRPDIPGTVTLSGLLMDDYTVRATVNAPGLYIKDVTYGGRSVLYEPFRLGSAVAGTGLRVAVGQDGAALTAIVTDKDGAPVADSTVIAMPAGTPSEGVLAARIVSGQTDQLGQYVFEPLGPGTYYVVATEDAYDMTLESIGKLWQSHLRYQKVELAARGVIKVGLQVVSIR